MTPYFGKYDPHTLESMTPLLWKVTHTLEAQHDVKTPLEAQLPTLRQIKTHTYFTDKLYLIFYIKLTMLFYIQPSFIVVLTALYLQL